MSQPKTPIVCSNCHSTNVTYTEATMSGLDLINLVSGETKMDKTKFKKHSILNLFVKRVDDKYHLYTNIFIIVLISIILSIIIAVMTNMIFPIMVTFIFMGMFILLSI